MILYGKDSHFPSEFSVASPTLQKSWYIHINLSGCGLGNIWDETVKGYDLPRSHSLADVLEGAELC